MFVFWFFFSNKIIFTPSQITGSKYSISFIAHCSQILRKISLNEIEKDISNKDSIDVRCRVLFLDKDKSVSIFFEQKNNKPNNCHNISLFILIIGIFIRDNNGSLTVTQTIPIEMFLDKKGNENRNVEIFDCLTVGSNC